jgi:hypothetical protein
VRDLGRREGRERESIVVAVEYCGRSRDVVLFAGLG